MPAMRKVLAVLTADSKMLGRDLTKAEKRLQKFGKRAKKSIARGWGKATSLLGAAGGIGLGMAFKGVEEFEDKLQRVGSQARYSAQEIDDLRKRIDKASESKGVDRFQLLEGLEEAVNLMGGDGVEQLDNMATALNATGAEAKSISGLMFALSENMQVDPSGMQAALSAIDKIGTVKSIPMSELASELPAVTGMAKDFGATGVRGTAQITAAMQLLRTEFKGAAEVGTALTGAMRSFAKNEKLIKGLGVSVRDANGEFRPMLDIIDDLGGKTGGDVGKLIKVMGRFEGSTAVKVLIKRRQEMQELVRMGVEAGEQNFLAIRDQERQNSVAGRYESTMARVKLAMAKAFSPERMEKIVKIFEKLVDLLGWVVEHAKTSAAIFAGLKLAPGLLSLVSTVASLKGAGGLAGLLKGAGGKAAGALGGGAGLASFALPAAAGVGGYMAGSWADKKFGISDALVGVDSGPGPQTNREQMQHELDFYRKSDPKGAAGRIKQLEDAIAAEDHRVSEAKRIAGIRANSDLSANRSLGVAAGLVSSHGGGLGSVSPEAMSFARKIGVEGEISGKGPSMADLSKLAQMISDRPITIEIDGERVGTRKARQGNGG